MTHRILVVEDNLLNCELLCDWLEVEGYDVVSAASLSEAFAALEDETPHAILLDVQLGAEDGLALAEWVRNAPRLRHVPIIAVTAHAMVTDQQRVMQAGCIACVSKPIDFKCLKEHLQACISNQSVGKIEK